MKSHKIGAIYRPLAKKKILFVSCNGMKKYRVGRSVKKKFSLFFWSKMCVSCMFRVDWELGGLNSTTHVLGISSTTLVVILEGKITKYEEIGT